MERYLEAGLIVATHGVRGEIKILPWADGPEFLLEFDNIYVNGTSYAVESGRVHKTCALLKLQGPGTSKHHIGRHDATVKIIWPDGVQ